MARTAQQYRDHMLQLQPPGVALPTDPDSTWAQLLEALGAEAARVDGRVEDLLEEMDPRLASELLADWERITGLPDTCDPGIGSISDRREGVVARITSQGGQSRTYFIGLAEQLGFPNAEIIEYTPMTVDDNVDEPIYGEDWAYAWKLKAPLSDVDQINVESNVEESLGETAPTVRLECRINQLKPAHTVALFEYT